MEVTEAVMLGVVSLIANGAVTFGAVRTALRFLERELGEEREARRADVALVRASTEAAHRRIDDHISGVPRSRVSV